MTMPVMPSSTPGMSAVTALNAPPLLLMLKPFSPATSSRCSCASTAVTGPASGHRVVNLDQGEPVELVNVAHRIVKWLGSKSPVIVEGSAESVEFQLDITQARNHLGFKPVPLAQRVLEMAAKMESRP